MRFLRIGLLCLGSWLACSGAWAALIPSDELSLTAEQQNRRNRVSQEFNNGFSAVYISSTVAGFFPEPTVSYTAEIAALLADTKLKFSKGLLYAPQNLNLSPNAADECSYDFSLPQSTVFYDNILGFWPKLGDVALITGDYSFGDLGSFGFEDIHHANTEMRLSLSIPSDPGFEEFNAGPQDITLSPGTHSVEWRAETLWYPVWDTVVPGATTLVMLGSEFKWLKHAKKLPKMVKKIKKPANKLLRKFKKKPDLNNASTRNFFGRKTKPGPVSNAFADVKNLGAKFKKRLSKLNEKVNIFSKIKSRVNEFKRKHPKLFSRTKFVNKVRKKVKNEVRENDLRDSRENLLSRLATASDSEYADVLVDAMFTAVPTVSRSRLQTLTVYDTLPPTIATLDANPVFEATDIGGASAFRYLDEMRNFIDASDACGREVILVNDAPEFLPMGDTVVTWTARDLGPVNPNLVEDHDGDGLPDNDPYFSRSVTQTITIEDTQAPLILPPPGIVIESAVDIDLNSRQLGQPLVVDLADLHPDVSKSTPSPDGIVTPDTRTVVTWIAEDDATPPNQSTATQLVTVKTPGSNTQPTAADKTADTLTSQPVDIVLTGLDTDELPYTGGDPSITVADPLQFRIEQRPQNGEFVAPLYPYFIDDYRTDITGVLADDLAFAQAQNQMQWLETEYCDNQLEIPVNFVFNPLFVHVTDSGEQYFLDHYAVCDPNGTGSPPIESRVRISHWDQDRNFLGHVNYADSGNPGDAGSGSFVLDPDGNIYYLLDNGVNEKIVETCEPGDFSSGNTGGTCGNGYTLDSNASGNAGFDVSESKYARVDSSSTGNLADPLIFVNDGRGVAVFHGQIFKGLLQNDAREAEFLGVQFLNCSPIPGGGSNQSHGMELDSEGNLYIADSCRNRIHKFTASSLDGGNNLVPGSYVGWMGQCDGSTNLACDASLQRSKGFSCTDATCTVGGDGSGNGPGQFLDPVYLATDPNDVLYVADYSNQRVQRFAADGTFAGQAKSVGNGINAESEGSFVLGNMGPPRHVSVNSEQFFVVDQGEKFVHIFESSPFKDVTDSSATVSYVSNFAFHSDTDSFTYSVNDGLVDSNEATVSVNVARNYRQPLPETQPLVKTDEDTAVTIVLSGSDADGIIGRDFNPLDSLSFVIDEQPEFGQLVRCGDSCNAGLDDGRDTWIYTPGRDYHGSDSFSFTVRDTFTDAVSDGSTPIPEPYGEADPVTVEITVASVNDIPVVRIEPPQRVAAGFPFMFNATVSDDLAEDYVTTLDWGDGHVDREGDIEIDDKGTPNDSSDDETFLTGVILSYDGLSSIGDSPVNAMHTYAETGNRSVELCLRDDGQLKSCDAIEINVEQLVVLGAEVLPSDDQLADGVPFDVSISIDNPAPVGSVTGLNAEDLTMKIDIPGELILMSYLPSQGSCSLAQGRLSCSLGTLLNATGATIDLTLRGKGNLVYDQDVSLDAEVSTSSPALEAVILSSVSILLEAVTLDRDSDGLPNIFEAFYGVSDPAADDDGDGLDNLTELQQGTVPVNADSDGDGLDDGDEIAIHDTDPTSADTDGDGLNDDVELLVIGTNPLSSDSDEDGLPDQWEIDNGFDPLLDDSSGDGDGDGLSDIEEFQRDTDHQLADSDGDGLSDGDEVNTHESDPLEADTDQDGLDDDVELAAGTDLLKPDSDDDGLLDGDEVNIYGTLPRTADSDRDSLPDGWEIRDGRNPLEADYLLAAGGLSSCALTDAGVECWGRNDFGQAPPVVAGLVNPVDVTMGFLHACALDIETDGSPAVKCWGRNDFGQASVPPLVEPLQVAAGAYHTCALDRTAPGVVETVCWGRDQLNQVSGAPAVLEQPVKLVAGISGNSSCVLDDAVAGPQLICWGQYNNLNTSIPSSLTTADGPLALGSAHGCIVDDGNRLCWGLNDDGQAPAAPEPTNSVQLSLGGFHSCSLGQADDDKYDVACWGLDYNGQASVPADLTAPLKLASGSHHSCVLDQGSARCWGVENTFDQGQAPASRTLAIDPDGDGLPSAQEIALGTDPLEPDTDGDLLDDATEVAQGTNPLAADSDDDGLGDADEVLVYLSDPLNDDSDSDGIPDGWEADHGLSPTVDDAATDGDSDGLSSGTEFALDTDPENADSDSDGIDDGAELAMFRYRDSGQALGAAISEAVELGDLDGDGDLDAFVANRAGGSAIWNNDGEGNFTLDTDNALNTAEALDVALGDIDLDGDLDAVVAHPLDTQSNTLWLNGFGGDPEGMFTDSALDFGPGFSDGVELRIQSADGALPKLFVANWGSNKSHLFDGVTLVAGIVDDVFGWNSEDIAVGDLDGDGWDDAIAVNRDQSNQVFIATDASQTSMLEGPSFGGNDTSIAVALGDLDGDDDLDVFESIFGASDRIWLNDGFGNFSDSGQSIGSDNGSDVGLRDIDRDGDVDAIVANIGDSRLWLNDGAGLMQDSGSSFGTSNSFGLGLGDVDGDGSVDIFFANDGPNSVWLLSQLDPTAKDSDADDMFDGWEIDNGFDPLDAADAALDPDFDGLDNAGEFDADTDPNDSDTDNDGMPDGWEVDNGLDPLVDDSGLDLDIDGLSNLDEYLQGGVPEADDVPPVVTAPGTVAADSTGILTAVAIGSATAVDFKDGPVAASADDPGPYPPGRNTVTWSAADFSGNVGSAEQSIEVTPLVNFTINQVVSEGAAASVGVALNGAAVNYPVQVDFLVSGNATNPEDHDAMDGSIVIDAGTSGAMPINIVADAIFETAETLTLTIDTVTNAVPGSQFSHTLNIVEENIIPTADIVVMQQGSTVTTVAMDAGAVTVSASIFDPNPGDSHGFDWSYSDSGVYDPADFTDSSYSFDPQTLGEGIYRIVVEVADDAVPIGVNRASGTIRVVATLPLLDGQADSDGDGVSDLDEGWADSDNDGVPNYLDAYDTGSVLLLSDDGYQLETQTGLVLRLGENAIAAGAGAGLTEASIAEDFDFEFPDGIVDFEITGVAPGGSAMIVIPLQNEILANASYRKYINGSWQPFVEDGDNQIFSAPGSDGACPAPGDIEYLPGLNPGDGCIQLMLQDGGPNDADGAPNGTIIDPGGLALPADVRLEILPLSDLSVEDGSKNNVVLALRIDTDAGGVELDSMTLQASGSGDDRNIDKLNLVVDSNQNGLVDAGEPVIGSGNFAQDNGILSLLLTTPYVLPPGQTDLLVTLDF